MCDAKIFFRSSDASLELYMVYIFASENFLEFSGMVHYLILNVHTRLTRVVAVSATAHL